jgi:hypothetical protein
VKTLPEDRLIRKAVVQGIGRLLRDVYDQDAVGPVPDHIGQLLARWIPSNHWEPAKPASDDFVESWQDIPTAGHTYHI